MNSRILLEILCKERTSEALDEMLLKSDRYLKAESQASKAYEHVLSLELSEELRIAIDRTVSAYNNVEAEYGKGAYQLGFDDGVKILLRYISQI